MKFTTIASMALAALCGLTQVDAHGWLMQPVSRETGARTDESGSMGCPTNSPGQSTSVTPGQKLQVRYPRNNHIGGFIRWAIVPRGQESKAAFDSNVFFYTCRESGGCTPPGTNSKYTGDNGAAANSVMCGDTITLPTWLKAGDYVLQWTWMGAGSSYGNLEWANEQYRSCADLKFTSAGTGTKASCPAFQGGDRVSKLEGKGSNQCFYFHDNAIVSSVFKGEKGKADQYYRYGTPADVQKCGGGGGGGGQAANDAEGNATVQPAPVVDAKTTAPAAKNNNNGGGSGSKKEWEFCTTNSECANNCCANKLSDDGKMKCTPGGC